LSALTRYVSAKLSRSVTKFVSSGGFQGVIIDPDDDGAGLEPSVSVIPPGAGVTWLDASAWNDTQIWVS